MDFYSSDNFPVVSKKCRHFCLSNIVSSYIIRFLFHSIAFNKDWSSTWYKRYFTQFKCFSVICWCWPLWRTILSFVCLFFWVMALAISCLDGGHHSTVVKAATKRIVAICKYYISKARPTSLHNLPVPIMKYKNPLNWVVYSWYRFSVGLPFNGLRLTLPFCLWDKFSELQS